MFISKMLKEFSIQSRLSAKVMEGGVIIPIILSLAIMLQVFVSGSKDASIVDQDLKFDPENKVHLGALPESIDVGSYIFSFEIVLHDPEHKKIYATGGRSKFPIYVTGVVTVDHAEITILDSDLGNVETKKMLNFAGEKSVSLQANHLQKLRLDFQLTTPLGHAFKPHQVFLKLRHESKVEHIFVVGNSGKQFEIILDFLGLVEKLFYLSGKYDIQLTIGDSVMENSLLKSLGYVELDLPVPATFASLFHVGLAAVLLLYLLFWLKLNLFTTLKALGILGMFLMFVGHRTLSHLASTSAKVKSA
nr:dolichyl-diphosphooligosaccharide--protein glycosyltransferase subunit 2-like [Ipomoea batatas]